MHHTAVTFMPLLLLLKLFLYCLFAQNYTRITFTGLKWSANTYTLCPHGRGCPHSLEMYHPHSATRPAKRLADRPWCPSPCTLCSLMAALYFHIRLLLIRLLVNAQQQTMCSLTHPYILLPIPEAEMVIEYIVAWTWPHSLHRVSQVIMATPYMLCAFTVAVPKAFDQVTGKLVVLFDLVSRFMKFQNYWLKFQGFIDVKVWGPAIHAFIEVYKSLTSNVIAYYPKQ